MAITPLSLYFTTPLATTTNGGGATYTNFQVPTTLSQDQRVLAYALAAELLEFQLYLQAYLYVTGTAITVGGTTYTNATDALGYVYGAGTATVNGATVTAVNLGQSGSSFVPYLAEFTQIEYAHGQFLIAALGANPYPAGVSFAFGLHTLTTPAAVTQAVYGAELTGVSAYLGAIPSFTTQSPYLQTAASIQGTEARHTTALAAALNAASGSGNIETAPMYNEGSHSAGIDVPLVPDEILNGANVSPSGTGVTNITLPGGTITPVSGPNGAAIGTANTTAYPGTTTTYNGYVYLLS